MPRSNTSRAFTASAPLFAALGDELRLKLVSRLCTEGPLSISKLTEGSDVSRQAVTKHLRVLESAGIAHSNRDGRENVWILEPRSLEQARRHLDVISQQWDHALRRLQALVEDEC